MVSRTGFDIETASDYPSGNTLFVGQAHVGMAGVTAVDYLVRHLDSTEIGHVAPAELPAIAPFENGVPRHHSRLYAIDGTDILALVGELFVPVGAARGYADALLQWTDEQAMDEVVVFHGVPFPHGPDEHDVFHVATPRYREMRLPDETFNPLRGGFLDGVVGELVTRSLDESALETGVFITPTHPPGPDVDASLRLLDAVEGIYGLDIDETELEALGDQFEEYYKNLADRMASDAEREESLGGREYPEDRMYM